MNLEESDPFVAMCQFDTLAVNTKGGRQARGHPQRLDRKHTPITKAFLLPLARLLEYLGKLLEDPGKLLEYLGKLLKDPGKLLECQGTCAWRAR